MSISREIRPTQLYPLFEDSVDLVTVIARYNYLRPMMEKPPKNTDDTDGLPLLFIAALRSPKTWFSPLERALVQAGELRELSEQSTLSLVLNRDDLNKQGVKGLLAPEGMHGQSGGEDALPA